MLTERVRYLFLDPDGRDSQGRVDWALPADEAPGAWRPWAGAEELHRLGNLLRDPSMLIFFLGHVLYEAEFADERYDERGRLTAVAGRLRRRVDGWNAATARLFLADCAERVAPLHAYVALGDGRPRAAIAAARAHARGALEAGPMDLIAADAAAAARELEGTTASPPHTAARLAAETAARAARPGDLRPEAFGVAQLARNAVKAAPPAARAVVQPGARVTGTASEAGWQNERLFAYLGLARTPFGGRAPDADAAPEPAPGA